ncbi:MAG: hypothetical protein ACO3XI_17000 [bacterium]
MWAVIPFKRIQQAKQRLAPILSSEERELLSLNMLEDVLEAASSCEVFDGVLVATNCEEAIPIIRRKGILHLQTSADLGLNHAAGEAADWYSTKILEPCVCSPQTSHWLKLRSFGI